MKQPRPVFRIHQELFIVPEHKFVTIGGKAGSGKTMFLKQLYEFYKDLSYLVILFEENQCLSDIIETVQEQTKNFSQEQLQKLVILIDNPEIVNIINDPKIRYKFDVLRLLKCHKIFVTVPIRIDYSNVAPVYRINNTLMYGSDLVLTIERTYHENDLVFTVSVQKNRHMSMSHSMRTSKQDLMLRFHQCYATKLSNEYAFRLNEYLIAKMCRPDFSQRPISSTKQLFGYK